MIRAILFFSALIIYFLFMGKIFNIYIADLYHANSKSLLNLGLFTESLDQINSAVASNPEEPSYLRQRVKVLLALKALAVTSDESSEYTGLALEDMKEAAALNTKNLTTLRNLVPLYRFWATDTPQTGTATSYYGALKNMYHDDLGMIVDIAEQEKELGLSEDFERSVEMARKLRPEIVEWHPVFIE